MVPRHRLLFSLLLSTVVAGPAFAQPHRPKPVPHRAAKPGTPAQHSTKPAPNTLAGALASTYANEPALLAQRARLRATDENVPAALSGWRPTVVLAGTAGYGNGISRSYSPLFGGHYSISSERDIATGQATLTQPIYDGGRTAADINQAKEQVMAQRAALLVQEQNSFQNTVNAYVGTSSAPGVIPTQQLLQLNINNVEVLRRQLQATRERFRVGEITRTDVAQAEAALAGAESQLETARGNLQSARSRFEQAVGYVPPANLVEPQPLNLPVSSEKQASAIAAVNNPNVVEAKFTEAASKDAVNAAFAKLLPQLSLQAQTFAQENAGARSAESTGYSVVAQVSVPLYQGGSEYAAVRQAKQTVQQNERLVTYQQRAAVQAAIAAWDTYVAAKAATRSDRESIRANEIALQGVEREAIVGSRTTLDVLNAQQALLQSRTALVQDLANLVTDSYSVAAAIGRLTARDLHLNVPYYDDTAYYRAVKDKWVGLGDYATGQPNR